jgi:hypothetical protein
MKKIKTRGRRSLTREERTQIIIDGFRGLPEEFGMLKGLLCVDGIVEQGARKAGKDSLDCWAEYDHFRNAYDASRIANRMDEIRRQGLDKTQAMLDDMAILKAGRIYIGDNGRVMCSHLKCAGQTARYNGKDISGQQVQEVTAADLSIVPGFPDSFTCQCGAVTVKRAVEAA